MTEQENDGWRAGDLAVCINRIGWALKDGEPLGTECGPAAEALLRVIDVAAGIEFRNYFGGTCTMSALCFAEWPDRHFAACHFRKVKPDTKRADDAELVALIKRVRVGADA